ncbi:MAG: dihydroorotase [Chromatiales bacterium]
MRLVIQGGHVIDPANHIDAVTDVFVEGDRIGGVGRAPRSFKADRTLAARGLIVCPGLVELSARLGEPGYTQKGTIASETRAAAAGGVTTLCVPPDTLPVIDTPAVVELIHQRATASGHARVLCLGALTRELKSEQLAGMSGLKQVGCVGVSNARVPVPSTEVMRRAMEYAATVGVTVFLHAEDPWLAGQGHVHEGPFSTRLGLPGIPETAETVAVARELLLIEQTGARAHFCRLSAARSVAMIGEARRRGLPVTADVSIQHLHLIDEDVDAFNSFCHVRPPLRSRRDREGLRKGLKRGVITAICSDHQPHDQDAKRLPFDATDPGISALETWLPLTLRLVEEGVVDLPAAIAAMTCGPADILGIEAGTLTEGAQADVCVFDAEEHWQLTEQVMLSQGRNTPFLGATFKGRVCYTVYEGNIVHDRASRLPQPPRTARRRSNQ